MTNPMEDLPPDVDSVEIVTMLDSKGDATEDESRAVTVEAVEHLGNGEERRVYIDRSTSAS